jgi:hypothetical protein
MHYVFDIWITKEFSRNPWERYADDGIIHCLSEKQAQYIMDSLSKRMKECGLEIYPEKSRIVYCRSSNFNKHYKNEALTSSDIHSGADVAEVKKGEFLLVLLQQLEKKQERNFAIIYKKQ